MRIVIVNQFQKIVKDYMITKITKRMKKLKMEVMNQMMKVTQMKMILKETVG